MPLSRPVAALPLIAAGVTVLLWASAFVGIRSVGHTYSPGALALGRILVATIVLGVILRGRALPLPRGHDLRRIVAYGVLWLGAYNVALNAGEQHVDAGTAAMLTNVGPILIALGAGSLLGEGFPRKLLGGSAIAAAGAVVIGLSAGGDGHTSVRGVLLCLLAAALYAAAVLIQKPVLARVPALQCAFLGCAIGSLACLPFAPQLAGQTADASGNAIAGLVYLGVFPTAIGFSTWGFALARTEAGKLGATTYLVPAVATLLSWAILSEAPAALALVGGGLCLLGVAVTRLPARRARDAGDSGAARRRSGR